MENQQRLSQSVVDGDGVGAAMGAPDAGPAAWRLPHIFGGALVPTSATLWRRPQSNLRGATSHAAPTGASQLLREGLLVASSGAFDAYVTTVQNNRPLLRTLGRLRAITFAAAGEGDGSPIDIDGYDLDYHHLVVWDRNHRRVVGAYRLGVSDAIVQHRGVSGLYTHSLFDFDTRLVRALQPAMELGRAFVCPDYQRHDHVLPLMWRGIATWLTHHQPCRYLFGPVSVPFDYCNATRGFMLRHLVEAYGADTELTTKITARTPPNLGSAELASPAMTQPSTSASVGAPSTIDQFDEAVRRLDAHGRGLPVLLKYYLKLGGRILCVNDDVPFRVTDAFLVLDLQDTRSPLLRRFLKQAQRQRPSDVDEGAASRVSGAQVAA